METGRRKGADGALVPRRILDAFTVSVGGRPVIEAAMGAGIAANPLIAVSILAAPGAQIDVVWHEEGGARFTLSRPLPAV
jgi:sulfur-oxidizing protein SoxZ